MQKQVINSFSILMALCCLNLGYPTQCLATAPQPQSSPQVNRTPDKPVNLTPAETQQLIELFKGCVSTEQSCEVANSDKANVIKEQQQLLEVTTKEAADLKAKNDSNFKLYLGLALGALAAGAAAHFAH